MFAGHDQIVWEILTSRGLVEPTALQAAFAGHQAGGSPLARVVLDHGLLAKPALLRAVADHLGCAYAGELPDTLPGEALTLLAGGMANAYGVAPLAVDDCSVTLLAVDPFNPNIVNDLTFALERAVRVIVADPEKVAGLIRRYYGEEQASLADALSELESQLEADDKAVLSEADIEQLAGQTPIIRFVNAVLAQAIRDQASDLHFEPFEHEFRIRRRIDGTLQDLPPPRRSLALPIISRLKVLANLNIAERRLPQDGRIKVNLGGRAVDLRVSTLPTQFGESVVLRVLDQAAVRLQFAQIGLPAGVRLGVEEIIHRPNGIFLVTGPTGSGKTTTLYGCLTALNSSDAKLLTVEDPVEYEVPGVMQVPVNLAAGLTFARVLRTFLRQDPDIVMVGEIRDAETAQIAIQAALTGHLVLSTLHTNDAPGAITRLVDLGIAPFLLASTLEAVLAQRLLRRLCPACRAEHVPDDSLLRQLGVSRATLKGAPLHRAVGCPACNLSGYKGRIGVFEFMRMTEPLREMIVRGASLVDLRQKALDEGMTSLRDAGLAVLLAGDTTVEEVVKYT